MKVPHTGTMAAARNRRRWIAAILLVGLALRVCNVIATSEVPSVRHLIGDAAGYHAWAMRIAGGEWLGDEPFYQAPCYPYVLGVWMKVAGTKVIGIRLLQAAWGMLSVGCLCLGTSRLFGRGAGVVAAMMLVCYAPAIFFDGIVQKASLACVLICALMAIMASVGRRKGGWRYGLLGASLGLLVLTRENALIWLPIVGVWAAIGEWNRRTGFRWERLGSFMLGVGLVLIPVAARNAYVGGELSLSTFQAGPNFYIGNHRGADGRYQPLVRGHESPEFERNDATSLAEAASGRNLSPGEVSRYWMAQGLKDVRANPVWWLGLMARKMAMVWNAYEVSDAESMRVYEASSPVLSILASVWHFGVLCPVAAVGVMLSWRDRRRLWVYYLLIASMALAVAAFYVLARYRFPLVPLLIPFAATGCVEAWRLVGARAYRSLIPAAVVALVVAVGVNIDVHDERRLDAMAWMNAGVAAAREGDLPEATICFQRAVSGHPESAEANNNLAQALALQGDYAGSVVHYEKVLIAAPELPGVHFNLGVALENLGRYDEALVQFRLAFQRDPGDSEARAAISRLLAGTRERGSEGTRGERERGN